MSKLLKPEQRASPALLFSPRHFLSGNEENLEMLRQKFSVWGSFETLFILYHALY